MVTKINIFPKKKQQFTIFKQRFSANYFKLSFYRLFTIAT